MRRAAAVVLGTLAGTGMLIGAKVGNASPGDSATTSSTGTTAVIVTGPGGTVTSAAPTRPGASGKPTASPGGSPAAGRAASPTAATSTKSTTAPAPGPTKAKPTPTPTPTANGPKDGSYQASSTEKYGTLTLTVTISDHKITDVAANYKSSSPSYCTTKACPKLRSEALVAQSASIASVSGATYTSQAYKAALAAVLNAAGK